MTLFNSYAIIRYMKRLASPKHDVSQNPINRFEKVRKFASAALFGIALVKGYDAYHANQEVEEARYAEVDLDRSKAEVDADMATLKGIEETKYQEHQDDLGEFMLATAGLIVTQLPKVGRLIIEDQRPGPEK